MHIKILILLPVCLHDPWQPLLYDVLAIKDFSIGSPEKKHLYKYCVRWTPVHVYNKFVILNGELFRYTCGHIGIESRLCLHISRTERSGEPPVILSWECSCITACYPSSRTVEITYELLLLCYVFFGGAPQQVKPDSNSVQLLLNKLDRLILIHLDLTSSDRGFAATGVVISTKQDILFLTRNQFRQLVF